MNSVGLLLLLAAGVLGASAAGARHKRFVAFRKGSTFFYRLNYKVSTLPYTTMFAQASGFKVGWELPTTANRKGRSMSIREIQDGAELVYESHGFDGKLCLLKSLCQAMEYIQQKDGVLIKILNLLSGSQSSNGTTPALDPLVCRNYANHCPLHLIRFNAFAENY